MDTHYEYRVEKLGHIGIYNFAGSFIGYMNEKTQNGSPYVEVILYYRDPFFTATRDEAIRIVEGSFKYN